MDANRITLQTYENNLQNYINGTPQKISGEFKKYIDMLVSYIKKDDLILEVGTGFGRDADYIDSQGYIVERSDAVQGFIDYNISLGKQCRYLNLLDFSIDKTHYDLIFANAVLLHFTYDQFVSILDKFIEGLKHLGLIAFKLKYGEGEERSSHKMDGPRYFKYWTIEQLEKIFLNKKLEKIFLERTVDGKRIEGIIRKGF